MNNRKQQIADLADEIKNTVTPEQLAELAGGASSGSSGFTDWHARIDGLNLNDGTGSWFNGNVAGQLRELLHRIVAITHEIGGKAVKIGRRILKWLFSMFERYPRTCQIAVIMAALAFLVAHIPIIHYLLLPIAQAVAVGVVGYVFLGEFFGNVGKELAASR